MPVNSYSLLDTHRKVEKKFEQTIVSYIKTSEYGNQTDFKIKMTTVEAKNCTVRDSIRIMMVDSQEEQAWAIASEQKTLQYLKEMLKGCKAYMEEDRAWMQEEYKQQIHNSMRRINLLREAYPERITPYYGSWNQGEVLAIYVVCHYDIHWAKNNEHETRTETFIITPDGETVIGKETYGKLTPARKKARIDNPGRVLPTESIK